MVLISAYQVKFCAWFSLVLMLTEIARELILESFLNYFFVKKNLLVGASDMLWTGGSVDQWISGSAMYVCHTNQIGSTIKHQSNFLL